MVSQTSRHIHVIIGMVDQVEAPEKRNLVFYKMAKPSCKKIQYQTGKDNGAQRSRTNPMDQTKMILAGPSRNKYNTTRQQGVDHKMNRSESQVGGCVPPLAFFVMGLQERNEVFYHPEQNHACDEKARSFEGPFFKIAEIGDQRIHIKNFISSTSGAWPASAGLLFHPVQQA
jgi:hypothetical protein